MLLVDGEERDDIWLYRSLGFSFPPTDRELEIKLVSLLRKHSQEGSEPNVALFAFFNRVYDHFFDKEETEEQEGFQNKDSKDAPVDNDAVSDNSPAVTTTEEEKQPTAMVVSNVTYKRDKLNPILKQTIQRVISIDSKYRNIVTKDYLSSSASNFTIDLSEPLKDVLSIKLYSFQIPNTWYTVSSSYGSNFFYLKGNAPGINTGAFDYQISVLPGNYSNADLVTNISKSINTLKDLHPDVSFGLTDISYNSFNSKATFTIDIQDSYDQSNYYVDWVATPKPSRNDIPALYTDIPSYLGYAQQTYSLSHIQSLTVNYPNTNQDSVQNIYYLNLSNNFIHLYATGGYDFSFNLTFTLPTNSRYSRTQLQSNFESVLAACPYVNPALSSFSRVLSTDVSLSYYDFSVRLNRNMVPPITGYSFGVLFPTEDISNPYFPIWTGNGSCFHFAGSTSFFNQVQSENNILNNTFSVPHIPVVELSCVRPYYIDPSNVFVYPAYDLSTNIVGVVPSFSLADYTQGLNKALDLPIDPTHLTNTNTFLSTSSPILRFDFNMYFSTSDYYVDISGTVLGYLFYTINGDVATDTFYDLDTPTFSGLLGSTHLLSFPIPNNLPLLYVKPKYSRNGNGDPGANNLTIEFTHGVSPGVTFVVPFVSSLVPVRGFYNYSNLTRTQFVNDVNASFTNYFYELDADTPVSSSFFSFGTITSQGAPLNVTMNVKTILTQNDFALTLYDYDNFPLPDLSSSWVTNFGFSAQTYLLSDYHVGIETYTDITGSAFLRPSTSLYLDFATNFFYIRPFPNAFGVYTTLPATQYSNYQYNDIRVQIPIGYYDTNTLQLAIQSQLDANPLTQGSTFSYYPKVVALNDPQYALLQLVVAKTYTAQDYSLDFYDDFYFYKCYAGESSIRNTTWDTTLGWILGFRSTQYNLSQYQDVSLNDHFVASIISDVTVNVNMYSYFLITLDDFNQCRLNDGLVSITKPNNNIPLPSYTTLSENVCTNNTSPLGLATGSTAINQSNLTLNQVYAINQINTSLQTPISKSYSQGPFIKDIFGIIPLKTAGLQTGQVFSDYGGSLQQQERLYFGPVNLRRLQIQLFNNQGAIMDLNGADWSFSFVCEQLYQQTST